MRLFCFRFWFFLICVSILFTFNISAQHIEELFSPTFLALGPNYASFESPYADILNPAASGAKQRVNLDINYIALAGLGEEEGYGNAINMGISISTKVGVFTGSGHYIYSPFPGSNLGRLGAFNFSFSKNVFPKLNIGFGLTSYFGQQEDVGDWGLGASLGFLHMPDDFAFFKDFRWGVSVRNMGKAYNPVDDNRLLPRMFTPAVGADFKVLKTDNVYLAFSPNISFPSFQSIWLNCGMELGIKDTAFIQAGINLDIDEIQDETTERMPFSFGFVLKFKTDIERDIEFFDFTERGWNQSEIKTELASAPFQNDVWAFAAGVNITLGVIDEDPPEITLDAAGVIYVSPNLDGIKDDLILPIEIEDKRYVKGYRLVITDSAGNPVRIIENKDERPENINFRNIFAQIAYVQKEITVPESLRWDGKSDSGTVVDDGTYYYYVESWDDNGNSGVNSTRTVMVDKTHPALELEKEYEIFSPNNDGNKDTLEISLEGSEEDLWEGRILDVNGNVVTNFKWENNAPETFDWGGTNDDGTLVPDGVYSLDMSSTDRAGNASYFELNNIIINTLATPINITIDESYFSPNGDGVKDVVTISMNVPVKGGMEEWNLSILNSQNNTVKEFTGTDEIPDLIEFDGKGSAGNILAEAGYTGYLEVLYNNGNNPNASSPEFVIDLTPPNATVTADYRIFSPNNDGNKDQLTCTQSTSDEIQWIGWIMNVESNVVREFLWRGRADTNITWYGRDQEGTLLPDGEYTYKIMSTDRAGNYGESALVSIVINTEETPVFITTNFNYFSPNRDNVKDDINIIPYLQVTSGVESYVCKVMDSNNSVVKTFEGINEVPDEFIWNGKKSDGSTAADGAYKAEFNILYRNGNNPIAMSNVFEIDTVFPEIDLTTDYKLFSPNNDQRLDTLPVYQESSFEDLWEGEILSPDGEILKNYYWKGSALDFEWDGKDQNGNSMYNGFYKYIITATDRAGNRTEAFVNELELDITPTPIFIIVRSKGFSPNADEYLDTISFQMYITETRGIKSWDLRIVHKENGLQKLYFGTSLDNTSFEWDGYLENPDGSKILASEGVYYAELIVDYYKGNRPLEITRDFILDVSPPAVNLVISPELFSPDNDGENDDLHIQNEVFDISPIAQWKMEISGPKGKHFTSFFGLGTPTRDVIWDGVSDTGELVESAEDYPFEFTLIDDLGNKTVINELIPVDILVIRYGDRLQIRIPSITFSPGTPNYTSDELGADIVEKNLATIDRLAEIFNKYETYNIQIEGHAMNFYWDDPERAEREDREVLVPLSLERAKVIMEALIERGIDESRITTAGYGSQQPVVPFSDLDNRWKNRRVEFILRKQE